MATNPSLSEFLAQSKKGIYQSVFGEDYLQKQTYFTVDTDTGIFTSTFGRKVFDALNNKTRFFNALPKTVWGTTAGWRIRSDRGSNRSLPITETGSLPTVDVSAIQTVSSLPKIVGTTFGASVKAIFSAGLEGGVGDVLGMETENAEVDHIKEVGQQLNAGTAFLASAGGTTSVTIPAAIAATSFRIGDKISQYDVSATGFDRTSGSTISAINTSTGAITVASGTTYADGDVAFIYERAGLSSIDDIVAEDASTVGGAVSRSRAYDLTLGGRTAGGWNAAASASYNSGTGRDLSLNLIDTAIQKIRENGGEPNLILMGHDQYFKLERLLNSQQRYLGQEEFSVGVGDERTYPGTRTGMVLATYMGIPILPDADTAKSVSTADAVLGSNVYILSTDSLEVAIASPTQAIENRDYFAANSLVVRGLIYTMAELRCKNFIHQAKIADLNS